jgi:hypothetical protein
MCILPVCIGCVWFHLKALKWFVKTRTMAEQMVHERTVHVYFACLYRMWLVPFEAVMWFVKTRTMADHAECRSTVEALNLHSKTLLVRRFNSFFKTNFRLPAQTIQFTYIQ